MRIDQQQEGFENTIGQPSFGSMPGRNHHLTSRNNVLPQLTMDSTHQVAEGTTYRSGIRHNDSLFRDNSLYTQNKSTHDAHNNGFPKMDSTENRRPIKIPDLVKMARDMDPDVYLKYRQDK